MLGHVGPAENWPVDSQGYLQRNVDSTSLDGTMSIHIPSSTKMLDSSDNPLSEIHVETADPPADPPAGYHVLQAFNFNPDGATFNPGMNITISFNPSQVPTNKTVVLAFYNTSTGEWELIRGIINGNDTATFNITHFSVYTLMFRTEKNSPVSGMIVSIVAGIAVVLALVMLVIKRRRPHKHPVRVEPGKRGK